MSESVTLTDAEISALESSTSAAHTSLSLQHSEEINTIVFNDCKTGLGIKIVGGTSEDLEGNDHGIFVKRVIPGGLAAENGQLQEGDQILSVNRETLYPVSNDRAVQLLRSASASNCVTLVISRGQHTLRRFRLLIEGQLSRRSGLNSSITSQTGTSTTTSGGPRLGYPTLSSREGSQASSPTSSIDSSSLSPTSSIDSSSSSTLDHLLDGGHRPDLNSVTVSYLPGTRTPVRDRNITPSSHPSITSQTLTSPQLSPHPHSHHSSPQLGATRHQNRSTTSPYLNHRSRSPPSDTSHPHSQSQPSRGMAPLNNAPQMQGSSPTLQSSIPQQSPSTMQPLEATTMGAGVMHEPLPDRRSPAVGQPAQGTPIYHTEMHGYGEGAHPQMQLPSSLPPYMQRSIFMEPKMSSTPEGAGINGLPVKQSFTLPPGGDPSPVLPPYNLSQHSMQPIHYSQYSTSPTHSPRPASRSRRLSLDPQVRLKIDKLQVALAYLGIHPTEEQNQELTRRLSIDQDGMVPYGEFVAVAKQLFKIQLDDSNIGSGSMAEPPPFQPQLPVMPPTMPPTTTLAVSELDALRKERDDALQEVDKLKRLLLERESSYCTVEEELLRMRKEAQGAVHETRALKSRVHLAEVAQREARNMELDYEDVVCMLEDELHKLSSKVKKTPPPLPPEPKSSGPDPTELQKRLAVLGCELRKAEIGKKTYEVSTQKLLHFAEMVHEHLTHGPNAGLSTRNKGETARRGGNGFRPPGYLAKHKGPVNLGTEAKETVKAVKALIESEPLPYGWEEAYTTDGTKYFLNHVTQCTSWIHPVSSVNHLPTIREGDSLPETRA